MPTVRLTERVVFQGGKVRRPGVDGYAGAYPIVEGVLICGAKSANKRRYLPEAFAGDRIHRYKNRPVFLNHGKGRESRQYQDKVATLENERIRSDGMPVGDLAVNPRHPFAEAFLWDAEHKPNSCGMSHVAHCETREASDGWTEVTEVVEVESVDVVVDPATTKGLHESKNKGQQAMTTLRKFLESHTAAFKDADTQKRLRKALVEMDDAGDMASMSDMPMEDPGEGSEPDDALLQGFKAAIDAVWSQYTDDKDGAAAVKAISKYIKAHAKLTTGKDEPEEPSEPKDDAEPPKESAKPNPWDVLKECTSENYTPTSIELELLALMPTSDKRKAYIAEQRAKTAKPEKPRSGGPKTPLAESKVPTDGAGFLASIRA